MPSTFQFLFNKRRLFVLTLTSIALVSYLALPGQQMKWLLTSVSATTSAEVNEVSSSSAVSPGAISFAAGTSSVKEGDGFANITLTRMGGSDNQVVAKVSLADVTTSPTDYRFTPGAIDRTFTVTTGPNNLVQSLLVQPDGKIITGGFPSPSSQLPRNNIVRLNIDGSQDTAFAPTVTGEVKAMALQPDGKILVAGGLSPSGGALNTGLLRLNSDGSIDPTFTMGTGGVYKVAILPDGKIIIGGNFSSYNGVTRNQIARLNNDGTLDSAFNAGDGPNGPVFALAVQPDGKVIVGGNFSQISGVTRLSIARLNADGGYDATFNSAPFVEKIFVRAIDLQPDGKVLVGGGFYSNITFSGTNPTPLARLQADGNIDPSFVDPGLGKGFGIGALKRQPDGKILVGGGAATVPNANIDPYLNRLNDNGALDTSFKSGATGYSNSRLESIALQGDGKIIVGGQLSTTPNNSAYYYVTRLEGDIFVTWESGDSADKIVSLPIVDDFLDESDETLNLTLTPLAGGAFTGTYTNAILTIIDGPPAVTQLSMRGEQGDYIGGPNDYFYAETDGSFGASAFDGSGDGIVDSVNLSFTGNGHWWYLDFNTYRVPSTNLVPGYYPNAERAPFTSTGHPGLSISGDGRGCNTLTGSFTVHESQFDYTGPTPKVIKFTASFEQHCEGGTAALVGTIYYRYTGSSPTYAITGKIVDTTGNGVNNVAVNLGGSQKLTTNTDSSGNYSFLNLIGGGNFFVTPATIASHVYAPPSRLIKVLNGNQTADFTAIPLYSISGKVTDNNGAAITGVQVRLTGSVSSTAFTDNSGNYSFANLRADGNYTVTPSRQYYGFAPEAQTFTTLSGNQTVNFTGTRLTFAVGGRVVDDFGIGISGVTINLSGTESATMQTDSMGNYSFANLPAGGNYGITAIRPNYSFSPSGQSIFGLNSNVNSVNFIGRLVNYNISGIVLDVNGNAVSNVTLTLSGSKTGTTTTNLNGVYAFTAQAEGNYTVTPSKSNYTFVPTSRTFNNLSAAQQSANFTATPISVQFTTATYSVAEEAGHVAIVITRTGVTSGAATANYTTSDGSGLNACSSVTGMASSRCDYATSIGTLRFAAGETSKTIFIPIVDDNITDGNESFTLTLSNPSGAILGSTTSATVTITDNANTAGNPIDTANFFIRQHYIDFLGREPDPAGMAGWLNVYNNCGTTVAQPCDRIEISSAFFRSSEFQDRASFVYRFYSAVGKIPLYEGFMPDFAKVSGFLTAQELEANKVAFVNEFMTRSDYQTLYGSISGNDAYVTALLTTLGLPNHARKAEWVNALNGGTTRAVVLRAVTEDGQVSQKYYTEAFVIMQYFGYLRRSADASYRSWIETMNNNGGDYRTMINGFLNSAEYRNRFGQ